MAVAGKTFGTYPATRRLVANCRHRKVLRVMGWRQVRRLRRVFGKGFFPEEVLPWHSSCPTIQWELTFESAVYIARVHRIVDSAALIAASLYPKSFSASRSIWRFWIVGEFVITQ